jgi:hypothetical protein
MCIFGLVRVPGTVDFKWRRKEQEQHKIKQDQNRNRNRNEADTSFLKSELWWILIYVPETK